MVKICYLSVIFVILLVFSSSSSFAIENSGAYPNGVEGFMAGAIPPPGTYFLDYIEYYKATKLKDKDGNDIPVNFNLKAMANVFRVIHTTKQQILGGFWGMQIIVPVVKTDVSLTPAPGVNLSDGSSGLGDITIDPILISWHSKNFHYAVGLDIIVPSGSYNTRELAPVGNNYYTFEPVFAFTYLTDGGFDASAKFMYDFNRENNDTKYKSGQEFHFDYTLAYKIGNLSLGLGGYYYKQMTSDEVNGVETNAPGQGSGNKGQVFAAGPQLKYDYKNMFFTLKYQNEMEAKNRPEGNKFWGAFMYAF